MNITWYSHDELMPAAIARLDPVSIVLDVGAGIRPQQYFVPNVHIIVEPYLPYIDKIQASESGIPRKVYLNGTWEQVMALLPDKSVDSIFAIDVIEHFEKENGFSFLREAERIARSQVVIFTPLGFYPQSYEGEATDRWGFSGGYWQSHRSGWQPEDFGTGWDILACKEFHFTDQHDQPLEVGHGAFWAIKTLASMQVPMENRYYLSELDDELLARFTVNKLGEKMVSLFPEDLQDGIVRRLLDRMPATELAKYTGKRIFAGIYAKSKRLLFQRQ